MITLPQFFMPSTRDVDGEQHEIDLSSAVRWLRRPDFILFDECLATCSPWMDLNSHILVKF